MTYTFSRRTMYLLLGAATLFVSMCALNEWNPLGLLWVLGVPFLFLVPGALTLVIIRPGSLGALVRVPLMVGLSVLELMCLAYAANTFLPLFGIMRPLDTVSLVWSLLTLVFVLGVLAVPHVRSVSVSVPRYGIAAHLGDSALTIAPLLLVGLSVWGALRLNRGHDSTVTMWMLLLMALYLTVLMRYAERTARHVVPAALFLVGLALLLMTSLRGWYISGHDIQREFFVFQLAKDAGMWSIAAYQDAYNACLSITILPTFLANVLQVPDAYVFKALYQGFYALSGVVAYALFSCWLRVRYALSATLLLMAFPTFFQDMPFLIRQEVAFVFFGLMLLVLYMDSIPNTLQRMLTVAFGLGVVLSHYSTTYLVLFVLFGTNMLAPLVWRFVRSRTFLTRFSDSILAVGEGVPTPSVRRLTLPIIVAVFVLSVVWTGVVTHTDGHVREVAAETWHAVRFGGDGTRSIDVFALLSLKGRVPERTLDAYVREVVNVERARSSGEYYATSTYDVYPIVTLRATVLPVTPLGSTKVIGSVSLAELATYVGGLVAKVMQGALLVGLSYAVARGAWFRRLDSEYYLMALCSLGLVALCALFPVLSQEYGVFRAFQQALFTVAPFVIAGLAALGYWFGTTTERMLRYVFGDRVQAASVATYASGVVGTMVICFLLYTSGFVGQLMGGNVPPVHLNNVGDEYRHYVLEEGERRAIAWLKGEVERVHAETGAYPLVQTDRFGEKKLRGYLRTRVGGDMFPGSVHTDAYVFVPQAVLETGAAFVYYDDVTIKYAYPIEWLDTYKVRVYDVGGVRIYR